MLKILTFTGVFFAGIALGGGLRYAQVEAQLSDVEIADSFVQPTNPSMGAVGGGSCG